MMAGPFSSEQPWSHIATTAEHGHCRNDASG